jgi:hypothetical protein
MVLQWLVAFGIVAAIIPLGIHQIPEGHVGIYYRYIKFSIVTPNNLSMYIAEEVLFSHR